MLYLFARYFGFFAHFGFCNTLLGAETNYVYLVIICNFFAELITFRKTKTFESLSPFSTDIRAQISSTNL